MIRGIMRMVARSGQICQSEGRTIDPMKTTSRQPSCRAMRQKPPSWPNLTQ